TQIYTIHLDDFENPDGSAEALQQMPKEWDYIVDNNLVLLEISNPHDLGRGGNVASKELGWEEQAMQSYFQLTSSILTARMGRGTLYPTLKLPDGLRYTPHAQVTLNVPPGSRAFVEH